MALAGATEIHLLFMKIRLWMCYPPRMSEIPKDDSENLDQNELSDEALTDVSGGTVDFSDGDLRSSMTGRRPPRANPF